MINKQKKRKRKQEDFYQTENVKKRKSQDHYLCTKNDRLKGHHSATWFGLIIIAVDCYNREASLSSSTTPTLNHNHPRGREETK